MKRSEMDARLEALYAEVQQPECKGLCKDSCGPIGMNPREHQRIAERGVKIPHHVDALEQLVETGDYTCPALKDGQCGVYDIRPMLCRLWGAIESLPCTYGCRPVGGLMPDVEASTLLAKSLDVGNPAAFTEEQLGRMKQRFDDPTFRRTFKSYVKNNQPGGPRRNGKQGKDATPRPMKPEQVIAELQKKAVSYTHL